MLWVEDPAVGRQLQKTADCATENLTRYVTRYVNKDRNSNCKCLQKSEETRISRNNQCIENKVERDKYH